MANEVWQQVETRKMVDADLPYIYATWMNGYYYGSSKPKDEDTAGKEIRKHRKIIEYLITHPAVCIIVACLKSDPEVIIGYCVSEEKEFKHLLHWVFVKTAWRKLGIGKQLIPHTITECSHLTRIAQNLKPAHWKYHPIF